MDSGLPPPAAADKDDQYFDRLGGEGEAGGAAVASGLLRAALATLARRRRGLRPGLARGRLAGRPLGDVALQRTLPAEFASVMRRRAATLRHPVSCCCCCCCCC